MKKNICRIFLIIQIKSFILTKGTRQFSTLFQLSEESKIVQQKCRIFAENELSVVAEENDKLAR